MTPFPAHLIPEALDLLQRVKQIVNTLGNYYVCYALCTATGARIHEQPNGKVANLLRQYVEADLATTGSVALDTHIARLMREAGVDRRLCQTVLGVYGPRYERLTRLAWIDRMIHQLELDGNLP